MRCAIVVLLLVLVQALQWAGDRWARRLAHGIRARLGNTFVLHGNTLDLVSARTDCDRDTILVSARPRATAGTNARQNSGLTWRAVSMRTPWEKLPKKVQEKVMLTFGSDRLAALMSAIYFARPDSRLGGQVLQVARGRMGEILAREAPVDADLVIPVPDSGNPAARGYARASGLPFERVATAVASWNTLIAQEPDDPALRLLLRTTFAAGEFGFGRDESTFDGGF